ncbi:MAG TPA: NDP-sugar synthase [Candidatus Dormibacteraeota bacterium]|nr:NDP-sugar synthase [Candidatus Dormibacteraeota bacterium]
MVLAGGKSTRLYPLTLATPKPLVPIAGEANVAHVLRYLRSYGITEVAINVHYHAAQVVEYFGDGSAFGVRLTYLHEKELLGSAGAVEQMGAFFDEGTFVVVGCDDLTDLRLDQLVDVHRAREAVATIALVHANDVTQYGVVCLDEDGRIREFQEKPAKGEERSHLVNTGIYVFEPGIFRHIPAGVFVDFGKDVFPALLRAGAPFYGHRSEHYWCDIGTPGEYRRATRDVLGGTLRLPGLRALGIHESAVVDPSATFEGDVLVGPRTRIGAGAHIAGPTVIGSDCVIGAGARLRACILWNRVHVGERAALHDVILGHGEEVAAESSVAGEVLAPGG